jgi:molybdopterin-guanine dinucleotide biosynthesis protein A
MGGGKALVSFRGRPLIEWPLAALRAVLDEVVVVAKRDTELPPGLDVLIEPDEPRHPAVGLIAALRQGGPILACAVDMPFVTGDLLRALGLGRAPLRCARAAGRLQPLPGLYGPAALQALRTDGPLTAMVEAMDPEILDWPDERAFFNVNSPEDLSRT